MDQNHKNQENGHSKKLQETTETPMPTPSSCEHCGAPTDKLYQWPGGFLCEVCNEDALEFVKTLQSVDNWQPSPVDYENLSDKNKDLVLRMGDEHQVKKVLDQEIKNLPVNQKTDKQRAYEKRKVFNEARRVKKPTTTEDIAAYLKSHMGRNRGEKPAAVTYDLVRDLFWEFWCQVIKLETGINMKKPERRKKISKETKLAMKNMCHWLIGSTAGDWDPRKSLFIWGNLGVGKSTLAMAGHYTLKWIRHKHEWGARYYDMVSMDEIFLETYTTQALKGISKLVHGQWLLDELKQDHLKYKHFGNEILMINDILNARHNLWKRSGENTIITSNISPKKMSEILEDPRLQDRLKQQYNNFEMKGANMRHPKQRM